MSTVITVVVAVSDVTVVVVIADVVGCSGCVGWMTIHHQESHLKLLDHLQVLQLLLLPVQIIPDNLQAPCTLLIVAITAKKILEQDRADLKGRTKDQPQIRNIHLCTALVVGQVGEMAAEGSQQDVVLQRYQAQRFLELMKLLLRCCKVNVAERRHGL